MSHVFNQYIAKEYGVPVAIFLQNLHYWIIHNQQRKTHFYDNKYWTYNTQDALSETFIYYSRDQIKRILATLKNEGLIITGNFNKNKFDKTSWYTLTEKGWKIFEWALQEELKAESHLSIGRFRPIGEVESPNRTGEIAQSLSTSNDNTDLNTNVNFLSSDIKKMREKIFDMIKNRSKKPLILDKKTSESIDSIIETGYDYDQIEDAYCNFLKDKIVVVRHMETNLSYFIKNIVQFLAVEKPKAKELPVAIKKNKEDIPKDHPLIREALKYKNKAS